MRNENIVVGIRRPNTGGNWWSGLAREEGQASPTDLKWTGKKATIEGGTRIGRSTAILTNGDGIFAFHWMNRMIG